MPFWFDDLGMAVHFKELTGSELQETFTRNLDLKGKRLLNYMNTVAVYKSKRLLQALTKFKVMRGELSGCSEDVKDMVLLLLSYFDEKEDTMFCYVEDTCLAGEVQMDQVQLTLLSKNVHSTFFCSFCHFFLSFLSNLRRLCCTMFFVTVSS